MAVVAFSSGSVVTCFVVCQCRSWEREKLFHFLKITFYLTHTTHLSALAIPFPKYLGGRPAKFAFNKSVLVLD